MKTLRLFLFIFLSFSTAFSQPNKKYYNGVMSQLYFERQPDPKSEAMGMGLVANNNGDLGSYYNPALTSQSEGVTFNYSHTFLFTKEKYYDFTGIGYANKKFGGFYISKYNWMTDVYDEGKYNNTIRTLNYSKEIINELFAGLNVNFVHLEFIDNVYVPNHGKQKSSDAVTIDFGILKNFVIDNSSNKSTVKIFRLGASIYNIGNTEIADNNHSNKSELLPVIFRAGMSFDINFMNRKQSSVSSDVQSFSHVEYEDILNDNADFPVVKFGEELTIADFLILRAGVISSRSYPSKVDAFKSEFTFGAGFKANFNKLFKSSDRAGFILDYAATQPTTKILEEGFLLWSLKINYIP